MKRCSVLWTLLLLCGVASAARHVGFETDAFNRVFPAAYSRNMVFSPASFELDCALIGESLDTIPKAAVAEKLGVILDFEGTYAPLIAEMACRTNGLVFISARAFCVPDMRKMLPAHCQHLERIYGAEIMPLFPRDGAQAWFRASMEGEMEDFEIAADNSNNDRYSFYDLASIDVAWAESFPTSNTRRMTFNGIDGRRQELDFMTDVRNVEMIETKDFVMVKLPLKGGSDFFALMPKDGAELSDIRANMSSTEIDNLLVMTSSITLPGVYHGPAVVALPKISLDSSIDLTAALQYFRFPTMGLRNVAGEAGHRVFMQRVKYSLAENSRFEPALERKAKENEIRISPGIKKLIFNRPFVFFVCHQETAAIPVVGQFTGKE